MLMQAHTDLKAEQPNLHRGHTQRYSSNQVQSVCWILDEAKAALQQVKVPDVAWAMPRLIHAPVNAARFRFEHKLQL